MLRKKVRIRQNKTEGKFGMFKNIFKEKSYDFREGVQ